MHVLRRRFAATEAGCAVLAPSANASPPPDPAAAATRPHARQQAGLAAERGRNASPGGPDAGGAGPHAERAAWAARAAAALGACPVRATELRGARLGAAE
eukprot:4131552-Lingulodinium_polyedra.AAC.1